MTQLPTCLIDSGPLLALLNKGDAHHLWATKALHRFTSPVLTCDGVIVEAQHILRRTGFSMTPLFDLLERRSLQLIRPQDEAVASTVSLARKFASVPMAWTDACLVNLSELYPRALICTLDSDFLVYRRFGKERLLLSMPDARSRNGNIASM